MPLLSQSEVKPKPIVSCSHAFSRAWRQLCIFASSSDWFIELLGSVLLVIGQSNYCGFVLMTLNQKTALQFQVGKDVLRHDIFRLSINTKFD